MTEIKLSVPEESLLALKLNSDQFAAELRMAAAAKFYELGRLSSGAAAKIGGVPRSLFGQACRLWCGHVSYDSRGIDQRNSPCLTLYATRLRFNICINSDC